MNLQNFCFANLLICEALRKSSLRVIWQRWCCSVGAACRVAGYLWSRRLQWLGIGGRLHTLRSGYVPCLRPALPSSSCPGEGGEAEKALIISIDCASSRPRDTAASGQHRPRGCPPIILQTQPDSNKISPFTHLSLVDAEDWQQLCLFYRELLLMLHLVQLVAIKLEKLPPSNRVGSSDHRG